MSASKRDTILNKLRAARQPFTDVPPVEERRRMVVMDDTSPDTLYARFIEESQKLKCVIHETASASDAVETVMDILGDDTQALTWDFDRIPLPGLADAMQQKGVSRADLRDETVRVGITGVDAAIASTGSIAVVSDKGKSRQASLLPIVHVAVVRKDQILPDFEAFFEQQRAQGMSAFDQSNIAFISGPSKSADIAAELIHGMHGPGTVHLIIVP